MKRALIALLTGAGFATLLLFMLEGKEGAVTIAVTTGIFFTGFTASILGSADKTLTDDKKDADTTKALTEEELFDYFFGYKMRSGAREFYCKQNELNGYPIAISVDFAFRVSEVKATTIAQEALVCLLHLQPNKKADFKGCKLSVYATERWRVIPRQKDGIAKGSVIFQIENAPKQAEEESKEVQLNPVLTDSTLTDDNFSKLSPTDADGKTTLNSYSTSSTRLASANEQQQVKEVKKEINDHKVEAPIYASKPADSNVDNQPTYRVVLTNLSSFDWFNLYATCSSPAANNQSETFQFGNVPIGSKVQLASRYNHVRLTMENAEGKTVHFRTLEIDKDSDINVTSIYVERD